jgi:hypothetical protein
LSISFLQDLSDGERNEKDVANIKSLSQKPSELDPVEVANGEQTVLKENVKASLDAKPLPEKLPFAKVVANGC